MTPDVDELGVRAADAVDSAARGVIDRPSVGTLRQRWQRRQRRRVAMGAVAAIAVIALVVLAVPDLRLAPPEIANPPTNDAASPSALPSPSASPAEGVDEVTAGGWVMASAGEAFTHTDSVLAAAHLDGRTVLVGYDESRGTKAPGVWLAGDDQAWRRVPRDRIDLGGPRYDGAALMMNDVAVSDDGTHVAIGSAWFGPRRTEPVAWVSTDRGESWQLFDDLGGEDEASIYAVTWGSRGFVMVGSRGGHASAWWEADEGWVEAEIGTEGALVAVAPIGDGYIATGFLGDGSALVLRHAIFVTGAIEPGAALPRWEPVNTDVGFQATTLLPSRDAILAGGSQLQDGDYDGAVAVSEDGAEWEPLAEGGLDGGSDGWVTQLAVTPDGEVLAVGVDAASAMIWTRTTGEWKRLPSELFPDRSEPGPVVLIDGEPVVFGLLGDPVGSRNQVVTWQRAGS